MKTLLALGIVAVVACLYLTSRQRRVEPPPIVVSSSGPTIERLERLSQLVTSRVQVADVLIGTGEGCRGAWLIRGDALLAINLSHAAIIERDEEHKRAIIELPLPDILQARVDHERSKTWAVSRMTWLPWSADQDRLRDEVMLQAQRMVATAAGSQENMEQAKRSAEVIIVALYEQVGWHVEVRWREPQFSAAPGVQIETSQ